MQCVIKNFGTESQEQNLRKPKNKYNRCKIFTTSFLYRRYRYKTKITISTEERIKNDKTYQIHSCPGRPDCDGRFVRIVDKKNKSD